MAALTKIPTEQELRAMIGDGAYIAWNAFCAEIDARYDMERLWNGGGKKWTYEYKYRRGGKTLCALYAAAGRFGLMIVFGRDEREKFETIRGTLSPETQEAYDAATTYHDGKWVMFSDRLPLDDLRTLLSIKRKPNKK